MTAQANPRSAREIFTAAVNLPEDASRGEFLDRACGQDKSLRQRVDALLVANEQGEQNPLQVAVKQIAGEFASEPILNETMLVDTAKKGSSAWASEFDAAGQRRIGPYKIRERLGEGGMGYVFVAEQAEPVRRRVALKIIKPGLDTDEVIARFEAERQALAMMSHPNIAKVLDGGATEKGRPYFVMELVRGTSITKFCDEHKLTTRERLELLVPVCQAVQHAHMKGIIHRDLKPSNVMVEVHDVKPVPKVIDFGVAKATGERLTEQTIYTQFAQLVGTPLYMSPEQAKQSAIDIDTRSDIYSLGVMLYELLTGTTPFDRNKLSSVNVTELRRIICEDEPQRPSVQVSTLRNELQSTIASTRKVEVKQLSLSLRRELDWIVMKAMEKDRNRRYETATELAADIQRYLNNEPVQACPPSVIYRITKYAKKKKGLLATATVLIGMLVASSVISSVFAVQANSAKTSAEQSEQDAKDAQAAAENEKEKAIAAQNQSDQNFKAALAAIDKLLEHASSKELGEIPGAQLTRKKVLVDALAFYDKFEVNQEHPPSVQRRAALTWKTLAVLASEVGDNPTAERGFTEAYQRLKRLKNVQADQSWVALDFIVAAVDFGDFLLTRRNKPDSAEPYFEEALAQVRSLQGKVANADQSELADAEIPSAVLTLAEFRAKLGLAGIAASRDAFETQRVILQQLNLKRGQIEEDHHLTIAELDLQNAQLASRISVQNGDEAFRKLISTTRESLPKNPSRDAKFQYAKLLLAGRKFYADRSLDPDFAIGVTVEAANLAQDLALDFPGIPRYEELLKRSLSQIFRLIVKRKMPSIVSIMQQQGISGYRVPDATQIEEVTRLIAEQPESKLHHLIRAKLFFELDNLDAAKRDIRRVLELYPLDFGLHLSYARMLHSGDNRLDELTKAIERFPKVGCYHHFRGVSQKDRKSAIRDLENAIKYDRSQLEDWYRFDLERIRGSDHFQNGRYQESVDSYNKALEVSPLSAFVYKQRAVAHFRLGNFNAAMADLEKAIELDSRDASNVWYIDAHDVATCEDGEFQRRMRAFADRVVEMQNRSTDSLVVRAPLLAAFGETEKAARDLEVAILERGDDDALQYDQTFYHGALLAAHFGRDKQYERICARMLETFGQSSNVSNCYFTAWTFALAPEATADYQAVIELAQKSVAEQSDNAPYRTGLGAILFRSGELEEAKQQLTEAIRLSALTDDVPTYSHYFLAMTEQALGNSQAATANLTKANELTEDELADTTRWNRKLTLELLRKEAEQQASPAEVEAKTRD